VLAALALIDSLAAEREALGVAEGLVTRRRVRHESIGPDRVSRRRDVARRSLRLRRGTELGCHDRSRVRRRRTGIGDSWTRRAFSNLRVIGQGAAASNLRVSMQTQ
jgi:hypothetical protein